VTFDQKLVKRANQYQDNIVIELVK
jgi:hypothetical protein